MSVQVKIASGGVVDLSEGNFGVDFNEALIHQVVVAYMAGGRSGTSSQKNRGDVRGGGRKPWRQKGTGRARAGTIRSPIMRGGGQTFARSTRNYTQKVNRKMYRGAMRSILSELARQERLIVLEDFGINEVKTKVLASKLAELKINNALIVSADSDINMLKSAANIPNVSAMSASEVDPVSLVRFDQVLITSAALTKLDEALT